MDSMKNDLSELLSDFNKWKTMCHEIEFENLRLKDEVAQFQIQFQFIKEKEKNSLDEITNLKNIICAQQETISKISSHEDENKRLEAKISSVEEECEKLKETHLQELENRMVDISEKEYMMQTQVNEIRRTADDKIKAEKQKSDKFLDEKDAKIKILEQNIVDTKKNNDEKIMKLRLEYEAKLVKLQEKLVKIDKKPKHSVGLPNMSEIFRNKLQHVQQEYEEKISRLNSRILDLESNKIIPESPKRKLLFSRRSNFLR